MFLPDEIMGTSAGLSYTFLSVPVLVAVLIVSITPAFCEEAVFRGIVFNSFWPIGNKWIVIVLTGCIFGAFHGSIWRFFPTAILGMAMAYLLAETGNMVYNIMFHAINNLLPLVLMFGMQWLMDGFIRWPEARHIHRRVPTALPITSRRQGSTLR